MKGFHFIPSSEQCNVSLIGLSILFHAQTWYGVNLDTLLVLIPSLRLATVKNFKNMKARFSRL